MRLKTREGIRSLPTWSVDDDTHEDTGNDTSNWEGNEPTGVAPSNHSPVDGPEITVAKSDTNDGTDNALSGGNWNGETGGHNNSDGGSELHGETTGWRLQSKTVTEIAHNVVSISPETNDQGGSTVTETPNWDWGLVGELSSVPNQVDGGERTDGVGKIVGSVSEGSGGGSENLEERVQMFGLVVEMSSTGVHIVNVASELGLTVLSVDNVLTSTVGKALPGKEGHVLWSVPWSSVLGLNLFEWSDNILDLDLCGLLVGHTSSLCVSDSLCVNNIGNDVSTDTSSGKLLLGSTAGVVVLNNVDVDTLWRSWNWTTAKDHWAEKEVVPTEGPIFIDELALEEWNKEEEGKTSNTDSDTENAAENLTSSPVVDVERWSTLPNNQHGENSRGETKVNWNHDETPLEWLLAEEDTILGDEEEDGSKSTSNGGSNDPRSDDLSNTLSFPTPDDAILSEGSNTHTNNTTNDTVTKEELVFCSQG